MGGSNVILRPSDENTLARAIAVENDLADFMSNKPCWRHTVGRCCGEKPFDNGSRSLSVFGGFQYYYNWMRFALWVNIFVQSMIQDGYISAQQLCIIFGVFACFELLMLVLFHIICYMVGSTSWFTAHMGRDLFVSFLLLLIIDIALVNQFLAGRYKEGFPFEATTPSGTGVSVNDAWGSGTLVGAIPSNVQFNIQFMSFINIFVWTYLPLVVLPIDFTLRHGQHHHRFGQY